MGEIWGCAEAGRANDWTEGNRQGHNAISDQGRVKPTHPNSNAACISQGLERIDGNPGMQAARRGGW